jgi:hypothetical protein
MKIEKKKKKTHTEKNDADADLKKKKVAFFNLFLFFSADNKLCEAISYLFAIRLRLLSSSVIIIIIIINFFGQRICKAFPFLISHQNKKTTTLSSK